jgi:multidrug efflux pump subunit AcrB
MLIGTLVTIAGFVPIGFAQSSAGEYTFSIFAVVGIALLASWFVAMVFAPLLGLVLLRPPKAGSGRQTELDRDGLPRLADAGDARALVHHRADARGLRRRHPGAGAGAAAVLPVVGPPGTDRRPAPAAKRLDPCHRASGR